MEAVLVKIVRLPLFDEEVVKGFSGKDTKPFESSDSLFNFGPLILITNDPRLQMATRTRNAI